MAKSMQKKFRFKKMGGMNTVAEAGSLLPFGATGATLDDLRKRPDLPLELRDIENWFPQKRGGKTKTYGYELLKAAGSGVLTGMYRYIKSDGTTKFLVSHANKLYSLSGTTLTQIGTNELTNNAFTHFETAYDLCIVCDGNQAPKKYNGTTIAALGGSPPGKAQASLFLRDRLFVFGSSTDPSLLYYSDAGNIESGYASNFINCDVNDGQSITAIYPLFIPGQLDPVIIVGKTRSVGVVIGDGTLTNPFTFYKVNKETGVPGKRSIVQFAQDVAYLTYNGVKSYKTDIIDVNLQQRDISEEVDDQFADLDQSELGTSIAWHDVSNTRISFAVPEDGKTYPNVIWHWDTRTEQWYKERYPYGSDITAILIDSDGTWYHGDSSGNIYRHLTTLDSFNGSSINAFFKTDYLDFYEPHLLKRILEARVILRGEGMYNLGVSCKLDSGSRQGSAHQVRVTGAQYTWNGGTWNSTGSYLWGAASIDIRKFIPSGYFRNIEFTFSNSNANEPLDVFDFELLVEYCERR